MPAPRPPTPNSVKASTMSPPMSKVSHRPIRRAGARLRHGSRAHPHREGGCAGAWPRQVARDAGLLPAQNQRAISWGARPDHADPG